MTSPTSSRWRWRARCTTATSSASASARRSPSAPASSPAARARRAPRCWSAARSPRTATSRTACAASFAGRTAGLRPAPGHDGHGRTAGDDAAVPPAGPGRAGRVDEHEPARGRRPARPLPGGLAIADVPHLMPRVVLYHTDHAPRALPARVGFRTGAGGGGEWGGYRSARPHGARDRPLRDPLRPRRARARERPSGGRRRRRARRDRLLAQRRDPPETPPPSAAELEALEAVDPARLRELEFRDLRAAANERRAHA